MITFFTISFGAQWSMNFFKFWGENPKWNGSQVIWFYSWQPYWTDACLQSIEICLCMSSWNMWARFFLPHCIDLIFWIRLHTSPALIFLYWYESSLSSILSTYIDVTCTIHPRGNILTVTVLQTCQILKHLCQGSGNALYFGFLLQHALSICVDPFHQYVFNRGIYHTA